MRTEARATRLVLRSEAGLDLRLPVALELGSPRRLGSGLPLRVWEATTQSVAKVGALLTLTLTLTLTRSSYLAARAAALRRVITENEVTSSQP